LLLLQSTGPAALSLGCTLESSEKPSIFVIEYVEHIVHDSHVFLEFSNFNVYPLFF
jgi:hypothetical protein